MAASAPGVAPEELYLSVVVHFFVHPPPHELLQLADPPAACRQLAVFLLKELKASTPGRCRSNRLPASHLRKKLVSQRNLDKHEVQSQPCTEPSLT